MNNKIITAIFCHLFIFIKYKLSQQSQQSKMSQNIRQFNLYNYLAFKQREEYLMSILSNTNYDQMAQAINRLKQRMSQQSNQEMQKYEIISIKLKIIQQQTLESQLALQKYQKDSHLKIDKAANQIKIKIKSIRQTSGDKQVENDLTKELRELQNCRNKLLKLNKHRNEVMGQRLQRQIDTIKQSLNNKIGEDKKRILQVQQALNKEVKAIRERLLKNEQEDSQAALMQIEQLRNSIDQQIAGLRARRKQKKQTFLQLLETIIVKCKQSSQAHN